MSQEKKEVESYTIDMHECPYCETRYEDDEMQAEKCRDKCFEKKGIK